MLIDKFILLTNFALMVVHTFRTIHTLSSQALMFIRALSSQDPLCIDAHSHIEFARPNCFHALSHFECIHPLCIDVHSHFKFTYPLRFDVYSHIKFTITHCIDAYSHI